MSWLIYFCNFSKSLTVWFQHTIIGPKDEEGMAKAIDPDQTTLWAVGSDFTLSFVMRKPVFALCEHQRRRSTCADPRNLISVFVIHCLDSIIYLVATSEISCLQLASVAEQAALSPAWSQTLKTGFLMTRFTLLSQTCPFNTELFTVKHFPPFSSLSIEPRHEKTCLRGFRPGKTQTGLQPRRLARGYKFRI